MKILNQVRAWFLKVAVKRIFTEIPYSEKVRRNDSFRAFGERKFGESMDQPIGN